MFTCVILHVTLTFKRVKELYKKPVKNERKVLLTDFVHKNNSFVLLHTKVSLKQLTVFQANCFECFV